MDKKEIKKRLKELLKDKRYVHSLGVASVSRHLAETYGYADPDKAELAGLVHVQKIFLWWKCSSWQMKAVFPWIWHYITVRRSSMDRPDPFWRENCSV